MSIIFLPGEEKNERREQTQHRDVISAGRYWGRKRWEPYSSQRRSMSWVPLWAEAQFRPSLDPPLHLSLLHIQRVRLLFVEEAETGSALTFCKNWAGGLLWDLRDQRQSESALWRCDSAALGWVKPGDQEQVSLILEVLEHFPRKQAKERQVVFRPECKTPGLTHFVFNMSVLCSHFLFMHLLNIILKYKYLSYFSCISRRFGGGAGKGKCHPALFPEMCCLRKVKIEI